MVRTTTIIDPLTRCRCGHCAGTHECGACAWCECRTFIPDAGAPPRPYRGETAPGAEEGRYLHPAR